MLLTHTLQKFYRVTALKLLKIDANCRWSPLQRAGKAYQSMVWMDLEGGKLSTFGFSVDYNPRLLPTKALMEALEGVSLRDFEIQSRSRLSSRNGTAAGTSPEDANIRAYWELLERDAFVFHWVTETPGLPLNKKFQKRLARNAQLFKRIEAIEGIELYTADSSAKTVFLRAFDPVTDCWVLGFGTRPTLQDAFLKAELEIFGNISTHENSAKCPAETAINQNVLSANCRKIAKHHLLSRDSAVKELLDFLFLGEPIDTTRPQTSLNRANFQSLPTRSEQYFVALCQNQDLLPIFFGKEFIKSRDFYCAHPKLTEFFERKPRFHSYKFVPHPLD